MSDAIEDVSEDVSVAVANDVATCVYCECGLTVFDKALGDRPTDRHRDHLIPRSRGGSDHVENCVVACRACNLEKRDKTPSEWRQEGLPGWVYEKEKALASKYKMPARGRRQPDKTETKACIPGYGLLKSKMAVCLEHDQQMCRAPADWEISSFIDGTWGAYCARCARYYAPDLRRELDERRGVLHVLVQLREGTLNRERETALCAIARAGGVSLDEYLDLAVQMLIGEAVVRSHLKAAFPTLGLDVWESKRGDS